MDMCSDPEHEIYPHASLCLSRGTAAFMPTQQLLVAGSQIAPTPREPAHDLESFLWLALYVLYRHTHRRAGGRGWARAADLQEELARLFSALDAESIIGRRASRLNPMLGQDYFASIDALLAYHDEADPTTATSGFLQLLWVYIKNMQPEAATVLREDNPYVDYFLAQKSWLKHKPQRERRRQEHDITHDDIMHVLQILTGSIHISVVAQATKEPVEDDEEDREDVGNDEEEYDEEGETDEEEEFDKEETIVED